MASKPISYLGKNCPGTAAPGRDETHFVLAAMLGSGSAESASMWQAVVTGGMGGARVAVGWRGGGAWRDSMSKAMVQSHMLLRVVTDSRLRPWPIRNSIEGPAFARRANARRLELTPGRAS